jgi:5-methylthioadenosine/S-adenosylhomocysteine deaminase
MDMSLLIKNTTIVTMNKDRQVLHGDILIENDRILAIGNSVDTADIVIDGSGKAAIPGLIQSHVHLCQTLFRRQCDDLELLEWLKQYIWPLEGSHDTESIYYSVLLSCGELFKSGTTAIIDMETVRHTDAALEGIAQAGIRAISGKCMMDYGDGVHPGLMDDTEQSIRESVDLLEKWHGKCNGLIQYAFNPRFVVSCSEQLLKEVGKLAQKYGVKVHTHASENQGEIEVVENERGMRNVVYLHSLGLTGSNLILAHCIWLNEEEVSLLGETGTRVVHCPSSNLKLASGIAKIPDLIERGVHVSLAADSAACNNNLDQFLEMRLAALIHKPFYGPTAMPAEKVFELATIGGAMAMGMQDQIGSLEIGKKADLVLVDLNGLHAQPVLSDQSIYSQIVYQLKSSDVLYTIIDGRIVMENRQLTTIDEEEVKRGCNNAIVRVARRAGIVG